MLSKAEILFLQGQKIVSKPYERKLKCLIKRKIDVFRKETPLLSKLILDNSGKYDDSFMNFIPFKILRPGPVNNRGKPCD